MITIDEKHPCAVARYEAETKLNELRMQLRPLLSERDSKLQRYLAQSSAERSNERSKLDSEADHFYPAAPALIKFQLKTLRILTTKSQCWRERSKGS